MKKQNIAMTAALLLMSSTGTNQLSAQQTSQSALVTSSTKEASIIDVGNVECPIAGGAVGSMQEGSHVIHKGYRVGLCCDGCKKKFAADPDKYLKAAQADAAANAKKKKQ